MEDAQGPSQQPRLLPLDRLLLPLVRGDDHRGVQPPPHPLPPVRPAHRRGVSALGRHEYDIRRRGGTDVGGAGGTSPPSSTTCTTRWSGATIAASRRCTIACSAPCITNTTTWWTGWRLASNLAAAPRFERPMPFLAIPLDAQSVSRREAGRVLSGRLRLILNLLRDLCARSGPEQLVRCSLKFFTTARPSRSSPNCTFDVGPLTSDSVVRQSLMLEPRISIWRR